MMMMMMIFFSDVVSVVTVVAILILFGCFPDVAVCVFKRDFFRPELPGSTLLPLC